MGLQTQPQTREPALSVPDVLFCFEEDLAWIRRQFYGGGITKTEAKFSISSLLRILARTYIATDAAVNLRRSAEAFRAGLVAKGGAN